MISALYRHPKYKRRRMARVWAYRSVAARARKREEVGADADTLRRRELDDARGRVVREGATYRAGGVTRWQIRRSLRGRVDQLDVIVDGVLWRTLGQRRIRKILM